MGARMLQDQLNRGGVYVGRKHVGTLIKRMGIEALYRKPKTSTKHPAHKIYPYLLRGKNIEIGGSVCLDSTSLSKDNVITTNPQHELKYVEG